MPYALPALQGAGRVRRLLTGMSYPLLGVRLVLTHAATWPYLVAPVLINAAVFLTAAFVAWHGIALAMGLVWAPGAESGWFVHVAWYATAFLLRALAFLVIGVALYFTAGLVAIPFNDRLSEHVETLCLGPYEESFDWRVLLVDVLQSVAHSALSLVLWLGVMAPLFLLQLVPVAGSVLHFVLGTLVTSLFLAREMMDGCLSRRRMGYGHKLRVIRANGWVALGFGLVAAGMLWVPLLNFALLPMVVAGGALLYCHLETLGLVPDADGTGRYLPERHRVAALAEETCTPSDSDGPPDDERTNAS
jgi:uncharacterized protein involved in cysteine biosynthesis